MVYLWAAVGGWFICGQQSGVGLSVEKTAGSVVRGEEGCHMLGWLMF